MKIESTSGIDFTILFALFIKNSPFIQCLRECLFVVSSPQQLQAIKPSLSVNFSSFCVSTNLSKFLFIVAQLSCTNFPFAQRWGCSQADFRPLPFNGEHVNIIGIVGVEKGERSSESKTQSIGSIHHKHDGKWDWLSGLTALHV